MGRTAALLLLIFVGCGCAPKTDEGSTLIAAFPVVGYAHAGPVCPVESIPPDPACADRPVTGAVVLVLDEDGAVAAEVVTDGAGEFEIHLPAGVYTFAPQPVDGLMGTPPPFEVAVSGAIDGLDLAYDTGIR